MNLRAAIACLKDRIGESDPDEVGKEVWNQTVSVLESMEARIDQIARNQSEILNYIEALDDDLGALESQLVQRIVDDDDESME